MRHVDDGVLRRLADEPLAVPDKLAEHVAGCVRCSARHAQIAKDGEWAARLLAAPALVPDTDVAWARFQRALNESLEEGADRRPGPVSRFPRAHRFPPVSLRAGLAIGAVGTVVAGTAAAASLTTIFAPTHVAAVSVSQGDLRAITSFMGLGEGPVLGGFGAPAGSTTMRFGTITWSSAAIAQPASSLAQATAQAGFEVALPTRLPVGVGAAHRFIVQPRVSAKVTFNATATGLAGSSVVIDAGPAVLVEYGGVTGTDLPALAVLSMPRPTAASTGTSVGQIEAFLLGQPGIPPQLAEEVRLLGALNTTLPVPVPPGASVSSVKVGGWPGVLLADPSNAAAGVVWGGRQRHAPRGRRNR